MWRKCCYDDFSYCLVEKWHQSYLTSLNKSTMRSQITHQSFKITGCVVVKMSDGLFNDSHLVWCHEQCALVRIDELKKMSALIFDAHSIYAGCSKNNVTFIVSPLRQMLLSPRFRRKSGHIVNPLPPPPPTSWPSVCNVTPLFLDHLR